MDKDKKPESILQRALKYRVPIGFVMHMTSIWLIHNASLPLIIGAIAIIWWEFAREFRGNLRYLAQIGLMAISLLDVYLLLTQPNFATFFFPYFVLVRSLVLFAFGVLFGISNLDNIGAVYLTVTISCGVLVCLHFPTDILLTITMAVAGSDMFQYFAGKRFGKTKIVPSISPNKTLEGYIGAIVACMSIWFFGLIHEFSFLAFMWTIGLLIFGILGDLAESWWKRNHQLKDTSALLSAHGGILDRLDSHLAAWLWTIVFCTIYPQFYGKHFTTMDYGRINILVVVTWFGIWIRFLKSRV